MPSPHVAPRRYSRVWYGASFALGALLTLAAQNWYFSRPAARDEVGAPPPAPANTATRTRVGPKGPWGTLEYQNMPLEDPSGVFVDGARRLKPPRWVFAGQSARQLAQLLSGSDLSAAQKTILLDTNHWEKLADGFALSPPDELVQGLSKTVKQQLYPVLAQNPVNYVQRWPYRFPLNGLEDRFADSGLPADKMEIIRQQVYTNDGFLCLCVDRPLSQMFTTNEFQALVRVLYSSPTLLVRLRLGPDSDIAALTKYWGRGGRENIVRPILGSMARNRKGEVVNISGFLPPFARLRLYTYPDPHTDPGALRQDCFYTALNFFNRQPDARYLETQNTRKALETDYDRVRTPENFGDLIAIIDEAGTAIHICVYIADDVVYTKNGANYMQPWVLMKLTDMLTFFPSDQPLRVWIYRRRGM